MSLKLKIMVMITLGGGSSSGLSSSKVLSRLMSGCGSSSRRRSLRVETLCKFINAAEVNSNHPLVSVRIAASWALANLCDSVRHCIDRFTPSSSSVDLKDCTKMVSLLIDCSLRLTRDGDKIKANAVRALGNLSRFVPCSTQDFHIYVETERCLTSTSFLQLMWEDFSWLERMVHAFLSCVPCSIVFYISKHSRF
ncbi:uncharacterized protein LOC128125951 [Lactuca sativa]|uniref:uncharacterized protein LOC128125951 n=1 Tax=Lactuca sativa TaxID=4236 RepID=UPI0022B027E8|nr:uncharacterized protein LOC128125951 [Lactuca sativa]